jgi:nitrogen fixation NifU-like protein
MIEDRDKAFRVYSEKVMEHFTNPRNLGEIPDASGVGNVGNAICGDVMRMYIKVENDIIVDVKFKTFGCGAAIATSSMVTEMVKGKSIKEALQISNKAVAEALGGLPSIKMHCSVLAEQALRAALADYYKRQGKPVPFEVKGTEHSQHEH